MNILNYIS